MKITTTKSNIIINIEKHQAIWAFKKKIVINRDKIIQVKQLKKFQIKHYPQVRCPGTYFPHKLLAGSFYSRHAWTFYYLTKTRKIFNVEADNVLFIETKSKKYKYIIISASLLDKNELSKLLKY